MKQERWLFDRFEENRKEQERRKNWFNEAEVEKYRFILGAAVEALNSREKVSGEMYNPDQQNLVQKYAFLQSLNIIFESVDQNAWLAIRRHPIYSEAVSFNYDVRSGKSEQRISEIQDIISSKFVQLNNRCCI